MQCEVLSRAGEMHSSDNFSSRVVEVMQRIRNDVIRAEAARSKGAILHALCSPSSVIWLMAL